jgi:hypothetical protein
MSQKTYQAITQFRSHSLSKQFYPGELINQPSYDMLTDGEKLNFSEHTPGEFEAPSVPIDSELPPPPADDLIPEETVDLPVTNTSSGLEAPVLPDDLQENEMAQYPLTREEAFFPSEPVSESLVGPALEQEIHDSENEREALGTVLAENTDVAETSTDPSVSE